MADKYAILWDMDGVLVDSTQLHYHAWQVVLKPHSIPYSFEIFLSTFGQNNQAVITSLFNQPTQEFIDRLAWQKEEEFRSLVPGNLQLLTSVKDWLECFQRWGFSQAICSSAPEENVTTIVAETRIRPFFNAMVSAGNLPSKPDPAVFQRASELLGVPSENCLVMEDAPAGVEGARRGGMHSLAVLTTHPADELAHADLIVQDLSYLTNQNIEQLLGIKLKSGA